MWARTGRRLQPGQLSLIASEQQVTAAASADAPAVHSGWAASGALAEQQAGSSRQRFSAAAGAALAAAAMLPLALGTALADSGKEKGEQAGQGFQLLSMENKRRIFFKVGNSVVRGACGPSRSLQWGG